MAEAHEEGSHISWEGVEGDEGAKPPQNKAPSHGEGVGGGDTNTKYLTLYLCSNETLAAVDLAELRLFDLAGWISRNVGKDYSVRSLVSWKSLAEFFYFCFSTFHFRLDLDYCSCYLTESVIRKADNSNVLDL